MDGQKTDVPKAGKKRGRPKAMGTPEQRRAARARAKFEAHLWGLVDDDKTPHEVRGRALAMLEKAGAIPSAKKEAAPPTMLEHMQDLKKLNRAQLAERAVKLALSLMEKLTGDERSQLTAIFNQSAPAARQE